MDKVDKLLLKIGVPPHMKGYEYIKAALKVESARMMDVYEQVGRELYAAPVSVERAMRHAVEAAFDRMAPEVQKEIFGAVVDPKRGKATNKAFLMVLRLHLKEAKA